MKRRSFLCTIPALGLARNRALGGEVATTKPLTIIVAYPAGGATDTAARRLARPLERELARPVIVQNVPGAAGAVGVQRLLHSEPDGDTALYGSPNELILVPAINRAVRYEPSQFAILGVTGTTALLLATGAGSPFTSIQRLQDQARSGSREVTHASPGVGSLQHLVGAKLLSDLGVRGLHVAYKGAGPLIPDLIGNQVDVSVLTLFGGTLGFIQSGRLRSLGVLTRERAAVAPQLATLKETSGLDHPEYTLWGGLFVPAATPLAAQQRLNDAINAVLRDPAWRAASAAEGGQPATPLPLRELQERFDSEAVHYAAVARELAIRTD